MVSRYAECVGRDEVPVDRSLESNGKTARRWSGVRLATNFVAASAMALADRSAATTPATAARGTRQSTGEAIEAASWSFPPEGPAPGLW
jgi:hypothetical protein